MKNEVRCHCQSCTIRGLMGPAIIIAIGILFLLDRTHYGSLDFGNTWPAILVVIGIIQLTSSVASRAGHIENASQAGAPPVSPVPPVPPPASSAPVSPEGR